MAPEAAEEALSVPEGAEKALSAAEEAFSVQKVLRDIAPACVVTPVPVTGKPASTSNSMESLLGPTGPGSPTHKWLSPVWGLAVMGGLSQSFALANPSF